MQILGVASAAVLAVGGMASRVVGVASSSAALSVGVTSDSGMTIGNSTLLEITAGHLSMDQYTTNTTLTS